MFTSYFVDYHTFLLTNYCAIIWQQRVFAHLHWSSYCRQYRRPLFQL